MDLAEPSATEQFFRGYTEATFSKGKHLIEGGEVPSGVFYLKKGFVRQYAISETGDTLVLHVFKPGSFFPMMWAINDTPNTHFFEALGAVEVMRAPKAAVVAFLRKHPEIVMDLTSRLLYGASGVLKRMEHLVLETAYVKTIELLLYYAKNFGSWDEQRKSVAFRLTHRELASWIGTTRETASLQLEELARQGIVVSRGLGRIFIPDVKRLSEAAAQK